MLNTLQKERAAENHHMIAEFLNQRGLSEREYYDVVVFGYLRAISICDSEAVLNDMIISEMENDLNEYHSASFNRDMEMSLERLDTRYAKTNPATSGNPRMKQLVNVLNSVFSVKERNLICRMQQGYRIEEAAEASMLSITDADNCVKRARYFAQKLRCA